MTDLAPFAPIPVPPLGPRPGSEAVTLAGWLAEVGEAVAAGRPVAELTVPGLLVEAVSPADGVLVRRNVAAGGRVDLHEPLGWVER